MLIKAYAATTHYKLIDEKMATSEFGDVINFLTALTTCHQTVPSKEQYLYDQDDTPLYLGVQQDLSNQYKMHQLGFWPCLVRATKIRSIAELFRGNSE